MTRGRPIGIGQVGLGAITVDHREGYRRYGLPVVAGFDPDELARDRFTSDTPGSTAYSSLQGLLSDEQVEVIDFAVPHHRKARLEAIEAIARSGKPVLIQKPLGMTYGDAVEYVDLLAASGVRAMVNQNMCFTPAALVLERAIMKERVVGEPTLARISAQFLFDTDKHSWFGRDERWWTVGVTVHHVGLLQLLFGPPLSVYAVLGRDTAQPGVLHEGYGNLALRYGSGLHVLIDSTGTYYGANPSFHSEESIWIQGPMGVVDWKPDENPLLSQRGADPSSPTRVKLGTTVTGNWFPDAFGLAMAHFQAAISEQTEPLCSSADNLYVMAVVEAAYLSSRTNRVVGIEEIMGDRYDPDYGAGWDKGFNDWTPPARVEVSP